MPRIPIRDIPNAPGVVAQPTGGNLRRVNLGAAQGMLQQQTISPDAFSGPARGMQAIAEGIGSIAGAGEKFAKAALHLQAQVEENQVWKAMDALGEAHNAVAQDIASNPTNPQDYGPKMQKGLEDAYQRIIADQGLSPVARQKIEQRYNRYRIESVGQMQLAGVKALFSQNKEFAKSAYDRAVESGNTEEAIRIAQENNGTVFFAEEADGLVYHAKQKGEVLRVLQAAKSDPDEADKMLEDEGATKHIPEMLRLRLSDQVDTERRKGESENWEALVEGVANGTITSPEDVPLIFGEKFALKNASKIKSVFATNPDPVKQKEAWLSISGEIGQLDPADPKLKSKAYDLAMRISSEIASSDVRQMLKSELSSAEKGAEASRLTSQVNETLKLADDAGIFGEWSMKRIKEGKESDYKSRENSINKRHQIKIDADAWIKKNPNATSEELNKWIQGRIGREVKMLDRNWWQKVAPAMLGGLPAFVPMPRPSPINERADEVLKRHGVKLEEGSLQKAILDNAPRGAEVTLPGGHKVTSYGYADDPYTDSNSRKGIGAWSNKLEDGLSFAASRDVEEMLKESGVGKNDLVELTLDNGRRVTVRFSDRTARSVKGQALTGRWDIYNKKGLHPFDGVAVKSFRKVEA